MSQGFGAQREGDGQALTHMSIPSHLPAPSTATVQSQDPFRKSRAIGGHVKYDCRCESLSCQKEVRVFRGSMDQGFNDRPWEPLQLASGKFKANQAKGISQLDVQPSPVEQENARTRHVTQSGQPQLQWHAESTRARGWSSEVSREIA